MDTGINRCCHTCLTGIGTGQDCPSGFPICYSGSDYYKWQPKEQPKPTLRPCPFCHQPAETCAEPGFTTCSNSGCKSHGTWFTHAEWEGKPAPLPRLIGISGKMGCGKSTLAEKLRAMLKGGHRRSFAALLKEEVAERFDIPRERLDTHKEQWIMRDAFRMTAGMNKDMTIRELLQWYGTDVGWKLNPNHWVDLMDKALRHSTVNIAIIDDVRFPNEADFIKNNGGLLVRLNPYQGYNTPQPDSASHGSETALDDYQGWDAVFTPRKGQEHVEAIADYIVKIL